MIGLVLPRYWAGTRRARRASTCVCVLLLFAVGGLGVLPGLARASTPIPGTFGCVLRADAPNDIGGAAIGVGATDCSGVLITQEWVNTCIDVFNSNGNWYQTGTCNINTANGGVVTSSGEKTDAVAGHVYRTGDWGQVQNSSGKHSTTYASSGITFP